MVEYSKVNAQLTDTQQKKLETAVKNKKEQFSGWVWKFSMKNIYLHELLLTARQKTKLRNALSNNMSTDKKLSNPQISKIIQSAGF